VNAGRDEVEAAQPVDLEIVLRPEHRDASWLPPASVPVRPEPARPVRVGPAPEVVRSEPVRVETSRGARAASREVDLLTAVERLRMQIATLSLTLDVPDVVAARREREGMLSQLDDYLLPRLRRRDAPLLAVIGGSTGAGKSTLTNSLVRRVVSRSGVLRPTTRSPVLVHHPLDSGAFLSQRILPRLTRVTSEAPEPLQPIDPNAPRITGLRLVPHDGLAPGMAIIDAPDIDSLVETNRDLAVQLLQAADLWIFVTTAARYADAMPWELLRQAADRGVAVAVVLDRVPPESLADLRVHLATRLRDRGLGGAPLFVIPETETVDGFLPEPLVTPLQNWLRRVAGDEHARVVVADRTLKGVLGSLPARAELLALASDAQAVGWQLLHDEVDAVFSTARPRLLANLVDGSLLSGEVLARWQELMADGGFVRRLDGRPPSLGDRVSTAVSTSVRRDGDSAQPLDVPVTESVTAAIRAALRAATEDVLNRWRRHPFGSALLTARGHQVTSNDIEPQLERAVRDWRVEVSARVATAVQEAAAAGADAQIDAEAAADVMFVVAVDERAERSAAESAADSAGTVAAARRIVASFLGVAPVRAIAVEARADLVARAAVMLDTERRRLERLLESVETRTGRGAAVRLAAELVEAAR
jgi:hypothetical protein